MSYVQRKAKNTFEVNHCMGDGAIVRCGGAVGVEMGMFVGKGRVQKLGHLDVFGIV